MSTQEPGPETTEPMSAEKSPARKKLELLESTGEYLFHGSPTPGIEEFEPRQAMTGDRETKDMHNDGPPGVASAEIVNVAIFRAIVNKGNLPEGSPFSSSFDVDKKTQIYRVDSDTIRTLEGLKPTGYVYVFLRADFHPYSGIEWRSEDPVSPIDVVEVHLDDLPEYETGV